MTVEGTCDDPFGAVRAAFEANFAPTEEAMFDEGAAVAVTVDGELVVDLWGGTATFDDGLTAPWQRDTIVNAWSTTKTVSALACLTLIDRGDLDPYAPVARYWPEFAAAGKGDVEVRHVMSHTSGLSGWEQPVTMDDFYDWEKVTSLLAAQAPWWEPGTASGYHVISKGFLEGELVRRVTGQTTGQFLAEHIAGPLGAEFHIGTGAEHDRRIARIIPSPPRSTEGLDPATVAVRTLDNPPLDASKAFEIPWRRAQVPAANGHGNARGLALLHAPMACGGALNGVELVSPRTIDVALDVQCDGVDLVLGIPMRHGIGFALSVAGAPAGPNPRTFFWGGWGGSMGLIDVDARMSFGFLMNKMGAGTVGDLRAGRLLRAVYDSLARRG